MPDESSRLSAFAGEICELTRSRRSFTTETRSTRRFTEQQNRNEKTSPQRREERGGRPWERPAERVFLTPRAQDACAPRRTHKNPCQHSSTEALSFSVPLRVLRVPVVKGEVGGIRN